MINIKLNEQEIDVLIELLEEELAGERSATYHAVLSGIVDKMQNEMVDRFPLHPDNPNSF